ncbi:Myb/SANT-like DNA-binding domain-containing protein [Coemansia spiralis]|nr:Myb/SANT-like DNA-binding domain-containing protein [Coemansia spiralis]
MGSQDSPNAAAAAAVAAAAAAAAAAGTPISNSTHWSTEETKLLIKTWGDHRDEFAEIKRNLSVWNKVLERLLTAGFFRTVEQCRNRWKFLETKYRAAIREIETKSRTTWEFFDDMDMAKHGPDGSYKDRDSRRGSSASPPHQRYQSQKTVYQKHSPTSSPSDSAAASPFFTDPQGRVQLPPIRSTPVAFGFSGHSSSAGNDLNIPMQRDPSPHAHAHAPPSRYPQQQQSQQYSSRTHQKQQQQHSPANTNISRVRAASPTHYNNDYPPHTQGGVADHRNSRYASANRHSSSPSSLVPSVSRTSTHHQHQHHLYYPQHPPSSSQAHANPIPAPSHGSNRIFETSTASDGPAYDASSHHGGFNSSSLVQPLFARHYSSTSHHTSHSAAPGPYGAVNVQSPSSSSKAARVAALRSSYTHHDRASSADDGRYAEAHAPRRSLVFPSPSEPLYETPRTMSNNDDPSHAPVGILASRSRPLSDAAAAAAILTAIDEPSPAAERAERDLHLARKRKLHHASSIQATERSRCNSDPEPTYRDTDEGMDGRTLDESQRLSSISSALAAGEKVELVGTVRRVDLLSFLREQASIREQREAQRIQERRRFEEICTTEEWRFHEFQMSLMNMVQGSLAQHTTDDNGDDADCKNSQEPQEMRSRQGTLSSAPDEKDEYKRELQSKTKNTATAKGNARKIKTPLVSEPSEDLGALQNIQGSSNCKDGGSKKPRNHRSSKVSSAGGSEEGGAVDKAAGSAAHPWVHTPSLSFSTRNVSAAIDAVATESSDSARNESPAPSTPEECSDVDMESSNHHSSSTSSSPLQVRPAKA